jgi:hypothetical protein
MQYKADQCSLVNVCTIIDIELFARTLFRAHKFGVRIASSRSCYVH